MVICNSADFKIKIIFFIIARIFDFYMYRDDTQYYVLYVKYWSEAGICLWFIHYILNTEDIQ